jgi:LysR family nitrogen assimilation transcriptional regulator
MNLRQLRYFIGVIEAGGMSQAARVLHVAQQALGAQIAQLEQDLEAQLLIRHSRGVVPTAAGDKLYASATRILREVDGLRAEIRQLNSARKESLTIGIAPSIMLLMGTELLDLARETMPFAEVAFIEQPSFALTEAVSTGTLQAALVNETAIGPTIEHKALLVEDLLLVTAPANAPATESVTFAEALAFDLAVAPKRDPVRRILEAASELLNVPLKLAYEIQSVSAMKELMSKGLAACILPLGTVSAEASEGVLTVRRVTDPAIRRTLYLLRPANHTAFKNEAGFDQFISLAVQRIRTRLGSLAQDVKPMAAAELAT